MFCLRVRRPVGNLTALHPSPQPLLGPPPPPTPLLSRLRPQQHSIAAMSPSLVMHFSQVQPSDFQVTGLRKGAFNMNIMNLAYMKNGLGMDRTYIQTPRFSRVLVTANESAPEKTNLGFSLRGQETFQQFIKDVEANIQDQIARKYPDVRLGDFASRVSVSDKYPALFNANLVEKEGIKIFDQDCKEVEFKEFVSIAKQGGVDVRAIYEFGFVWIKGGRAGVSATVRMLQFFPQEKLERFAFVDE